MSTPLFFDDFNRANSGTLGNGWNQSDGPASFGVLNNQMFISHTANSQRYFARAAVSGAGVVALTMGEDSGSGTNERLYVGLKQNDTAAISGTNGYDGLFRSSGTCNLYRVDNGTRTTISSYTYGDLRGKECALKFDGDQVKLLVDGETIVTATDTTYRGTNPWGSLLVGANNTTYADDFKVWSSADYPPLEPHTTYRSRRQRMAALGGF